jgi:PAS domain-containing protein/DNA-binding CsgD family transcriptional regulator
MLDPLQLDAAVDTFLDIGLSSAGWTPALEALAQAVGSSGIVVLAGDSSGPLLGPMPHTAGMAELMQTYLRHDWGRLDDRFRGVPALIRRGLFTDDDCLPAELRPRSPYYQDFVVRGDLVGFVGLKLAINGRLACASIHRSRRQPGFSADEHAQLLRVAPRISMATSILMQIDAARLDGLTDALTAMTTPAFLLDPAGGVVRANAAAEALAGHGIDVRQGRLVAAGPDNEALQRLIARVLAPGEFAPALSGAPVALRRAGGRPLLVRAQRLSSRPALDYFSRARALVTVTDPDRRTPPGTRALRLLFGLTDKEAAVVAALLATAGDGPASAARCGIGYETPRTHLKNIQAKTATAGVADLMVLATRLDAAGDD